uniref:Serine/threonine-protein phosphatase 6 regulatory ankyrin repeat subunit B-like n=1 Tax=Diabrotica virgifera virgifera TaxID=50390 RepID=A0A6P7GUM2_DIAVI
MGAKVNEVNEMGFIIAKFCIENFHLKYSFPSTTISDYDYDEYAVNFLKFLTIAYNIDLNVCDEDGHTLSYFAAKYNSLKSLKYLKEQGADFSIFNKDKRTLIHEAARNGTFEVLRYLVEDCKIDVNVSDVDGNFPVHMIDITNSNVTILKFLKEKGANISISNRQKHTLLHEAARNGAFKVLRYLVGDCKMDVNVSDLKGNLPIDMIDMSDYNIALFKYLIEKGANLSTSKNQKYTLIHKAARIGAFKVLQYLVEDCKMDVNVSDVNGNLPVHLAAEFGRVDILMYLKEKGSNLSISNNKKHTLVHAAAQSGNLEVVQYLVEDCKMDVNVCDIHGNLPSHWAAFCDKVGILCYFESIGIDLNQYNNYGQTLVHLAAAGDAVETLNFLKNECKFSLDFGDNNGYTPSHIAVSYGNLKALKYLKEQGANLCISNKDKYTLVHTAAEYGTLDVLVYLVKECKLEVNVSDNNGNLPAHFAAKTNKVEILR